MCVLLIPVLFIPVNIFPCTFTYLSPFYQFKETLARPMLADGTMMNPAVSTSSAILKEVKATTARTANKVMEMDIRAIPLPGKVRR